MPKRRCKRARCRLLFVFTISIMLLGACGKKTSKEVFAYQDEMVQFTNSITALDAKINAIDADSQDAAEQLLSCCDELQEAFRRLSEMDVPDEYADVTILAERADKYMTEAVRQYHIAYEDDSIDEEALQTANRYYQKANTYLNYIGEVLLGSHVTINGAD